MPMAELRQHPWVADQMAALERERSRYEGNTSLEARTAAAASQDDPELLG